MLPCMMTGYSLPAGLSAGCQCLACRSLAHGGCLGRWHSVRMLTATAVPASQKLEWPYAAAAAVLWESKGPLALAAQQ